MYSITIQTQYMYCTFALAGLNWEAVLSRTAPAPFLGGKSPLTRLYFVRRFVNHICTATQPVGWV